MNQVSQYSLGDSRFLLEETTGMYYDQVTGYYYNLVSKINFLDTIVCYCAFVCLKNKCYTYKLQDNGLFYDGNQGCYYYFDVIAQKYRLHSQVHSDTALDPTNKPVLKKEHVNNLLENMSEESDSENSENSCNLVIKEDTEEETKHNKIEIEDNDPVPDPVEVKSEKLQEDKYDVKQESNVIHNAVKDEKEDIKSEECPSLPPSTCEVFILSNYQILK